MDRSEVVSIGGAAALGVLPAVGAGALALFAVPELVVHSAILAWLGTTYSIARHDALRARVGATLFWLAIEAFLAPVAVFAFVVGIPGEQSGAAEQVGAAIGGAIVFVTSWLLAWGVGIVLYLVSRRFEPTAST